MNLRISRVPVALLVVILTGSASRLPAQARVGTAQGQGRVYLETEVQKPAKPLAGNPTPRFPEILQQVEIRSGLVRTEFVVDTTGRPDTTSFKVIEASHDLFTKAVKVVLPAMRFSPAQVDGKKVKQLVRMPFKFSAP